MFKKNSSPSVRISEAELYEICHRIVQGENFVQSVYPKEKIVHLPTEVRRHFQLLIALQKPKAAWFHNYAGELFLFAFVAVFALTGKMAIEQYFSTKAEASQVEKNE